MDRHEVCKECVMDRDCLLQKHDDVESCSDYQEWLNDGWGTKPLNDLFD